MLQQHLTVHTGGILLIHPWRPWVCLGLVVPLLLKSSSSRIRACTDAQDAMTEVGKAGASHTWLQHAGSFYLHSPYRFPLPPELHRGFFLSFHCFPSLFVCNSHTPPCIFKWQALVQSYYDSSTLTLKNLVTPAPLYCPNAPASMLFKTIFCTF